MGEKKEVNMAREDEMERENGIAQRFWDILLRWSKHLQSESRACDRLRHDHWIEQSWKGGSGVGRFWRGREMRTEGERGRG